MQSTARSYPSHTSALALQFPGFVWPTGRHRNLNLRRGFAISRGTIDDPRRRPIANGCRVPLPQSAQGAGVLPIPGTLASAVVGSTPAALAAA